MSTNVVVNTYTHSVTYVTDKMMMSLKEIIRCSGLSPEKFVSDWKTLHRGISSWLDSRDLEQVLLEVFNPKTNALIGRWDFDIVYGYSGGGDMWVNTDDIKYHILKAGQWPSACDYRILLMTKPGRPNVAGWTHNHAALDGRLRPAELGNNHRWQRIEIWNRVLEGSQMITVDEAFKKFRGRLELTDREQEDASRRHNEIRDYLNTKFNVKRDFLTGSYKRWTKTKPLKDVDIFCVLGDKEKHRREKPPADLLKAFEDALVEKYGRDKVSRQRRSVTVEFGVKPDDDEDTGGKVMSFDVVPAFDKSNHYEIPDTGTSKGWTETDPEVHYDKAVAAQKAYDGHWKGIVRMTKKWNAHQSKPVKPSFLIESWPLELLVPPFGGDYRYEIKALLASLADRIDETWDDPAKLGPPVSDSMDYAARAAAKQKLRAGSDAAARAIQLEKQGKNGEALKAWRNEVFGPMFPLS